jgi:type IV pilus assembly protein PilV
MNQHSQRGMTLLESLVSILLFSIGLLALVGMLAFSVSAAGDSQYRVEATNHAQSLLQTIRSSVRRDPSTGEVDPIDLGLFSYATNTTGTPAQCQFTDSSPSTRHPALASWLQQVQRADTGLPGASGAATPWQQVTVTPTRFNEVRVILCWQQPSETALRRHEVVGHIN